MKKEKNTEPTAAEELCDELRQLADDYMTDDPEGRDMNAAGIVLRAVHFIVTREDKVTRLEAEVREMVGRESAAANRVVKLEGEIGRLKVKGGAPAAAPTIELTRVETAKCKHEWNTTVTPPVCIKCHNPKSARGRKSASNPAANIAVATVAGVTKIDPPSARGTLRRAVELEGGGTAAHPDDDDDFADGTLGGSGR